MSVLPEEKGNVAKKKLALTPEKEGNPKYKWVVLFAVKYEGNSRGCL